LRHPFINPRITAAFDQDDDDCTRIPFAFLQDTGKAARRANLADQRANLDMGGEAGLGAQRAAACKPAA
jgi:hypothetical protein